MALSKIPTNQNGKRNSDFEQVISKSPPAQLTPEQQELKLLLITVLGKMKEIVVTEGDSSAGKNTDDSHIIFFTAFLNCPMVFQRMVNKIVVSKRLVKPEDWAEAFCQTSLEDTIHVLCKAFGVNQNSISQLPKDELEYWKDVILRCAIFMMMKFDENFQVQPWKYHSYHGCVGSLPCIEEEILSPQRKTFDQILQQIPPQTKHTPTLHSAQKYKPIVVESLEDVSAAIEILQQLQCNDQDVNKKICSILPSVFLNLQGIVDSDLEKEDKFLKVFKTFLEVSRTPEGAIDLGAVLQYTSEHNAAQLVELLTKRTIPQNDDIFVGPVQFPWTQRFRSAAAEGVRCYDDDEKNIIMGKIAARLSKKIWSIDFHAHRTDPDLPFPSVRDLSFVKLLSLYIAAKFIYERIPLLRDTPMKIWRKVLQFDSSNPEHFESHSSEEWEEVCKALNSAAEEVITRDRLKEAKKSNKENDKAAANVEQMAPASQKLIQNFVSSAGNDSQEEEQAVVQIQNATGDSILLTEGTDSFPENEIEERVQDVAELFVSTSEQKTDGGVSTAADLLFSEDWFENSETAITQTNFTTIDQTQLDEIICQLEQNSDNECTAPGSATFVTTGSTCIPVIAHTQILETFPDVQIVDVGNVNFAAEARSSTYSGFDSNEILENPTPPQIEQIFYAITVTLNNGESFQISSAILKDAKDVFHIRRRDPKTINRLTKKDDETLSDNEFLMQETAKYTGYFLLEEFFEKAEILAHIIRSQKEVKRKKENNIKRILRHLLETEPGDERREIILSPSLCKAIFSTRRSKLKKGHVPFQSQCEDLLQHRLAEITTALSLTKDVSEILPSMRRIIVKMREGGLFLSSSLQEQINLLPHLYKEVLLKH